jgi:D-arginine dehydrogenase
MRDHHADVVVIGGGLAGAATAYFLAHHHHLRTIVLEREEHVGIHASGRNAAMIRQVTPAAGLLPLLVQGARFLAHPPPEMGPVPRRPCGSLLLLDHGRAEAMQTLASEWVARRVPAAWIEPAEVDGLVPLARGATFDAALYTHDDGVVDVSALLHGYLRAAVAAGASVRTGAPVRAIHTRAGRVCSVETDELHVVTPTVVNAAGAWCREVARMAGAQDIAFRPTRRHLMLASAPAAADPSRPILWDESHGLYFRPESGGLLLSACDETDHAPGEPAVDPSTLEDLAEKLDRWMPCLADVSVRRAWAGLRTLTPDGDFVLGPDPRVNGFVWCAGLGGHGVTASAAVGCIAAEAVAGHRGPSAQAPVRFARDRVG